MLLQKLKINILYVINKISVEHYLHTIYFRTYNIIVDSFILLIIFQFDKITTRDFYSSYFLIDVSVY